MVFAAAPARAQVVTSGANGVLVQRGCLDTPEQLWRIKENPSGNIVSLF